MADENLAAQHINKLYKWIKIEINILYYNNINIYILFILHIFTFYLYVPLR